MKIGLAQLNPIVGDLKGNCDKIIKAYDVLVNKGAELIVYPELSICGYPPRDLLIKAQFVKDIQRELNEVTKKIGKVPAIIGYVEGAEENIREGGRLYNTAGWCENGEIKIVGHKCLLPTYGVFDEHRYFKAGEEPLYYIWNGVRIGVTICEDIWTGKFKQMEHGKTCDPVQILADKGIDLMLNISASPWFHGKRHIREDLLENVAKRCNAPVVYCNQVGGNDELIFDGQSLITTREGKLHSHFPGFKEVVKVVDLDEAPYVTEDKEDIENVHDALVLGIHDYAKKSGFKKALIGLSGGIDSAVVAALATRALGQENVIGISLPSKISSQHSKNDAKALAKNLGIEFHTIDIAGIVDATEQTLKELFKNRERDVTEENIQARSRGIVLMAVSNKSGALLLSTGNKSEIAVGYCTLYGDMAGGLSVISDVTKTKVYQLAEFINHEKEIIPQNTITKPPSAELSPGQIDENSLYPYSELDPVIIAYIEEHKSIQEIIKLGYPEEMVRRVVSLIDRNEYKRKQMTIGLKITPLAFGVGRRMPIVQRYTQ